MNYIELSPYELGETKSIDSIEFLILYLANGTPNERRLAASGISKLSRHFKNECQKAVPFLISNLSMSYPQVRQYTLKALSLLDLSESDRNLISRAFYTEIKHYNVVLFEKILRINTRKDLDLVFTEKNGEPQSETKHIVINEIDRDNSSDIGDADLLYTEKNGEPQSETKHIVINEIDRDNSSDIGDADLLYTEKNGEPQSETKHIVINEIDRDNSNDIGDADLMKIKIELLKLIDINSLSNYVFKNSNIMGFLKYRKSDIVDQYKNIFPGFNALEKYDRYLIYSVFNLMIDNEINIIELSNRKYSTLTDTGKDFLNGILTQDKKDLPSIDERFKQVKIRKKKPSLNLAAHEIDFRDLSNFSYEDIIGRKDYNYQSLLEFLRLFLELILEMAKNNKLEKRSALIYIKVFNGGYFHLESMNILGLDFGLSRERIRQIKNKVMRQFIGKATSFTNGSTLFQRMLNDLVDKEDKIEIDKFLMLLDQLSDFFSFSKTVMIVTTFFKIRKKAAFTKWLNNTFYVQKKNYVYKTKKRILNENNISLEELSTLKQDFIQQLSNKTEDK
jgi:hypothetical protein